MIGPDGIVHDFTGETIAFQARHEFASFADEDVACFFKRAQVYGQTSLYSASKASGSRPRQKPSIASKFSADIHP